MLTVEVHDFRSIHERKPSTTRSQGRQSEFCLLRPARLQRLPLFLNYDPIDFLIASTATLVPILVATSKAQLPAAFKCCITAEA